MRIVYSFDKYSLIPNSLKHILKLSMISQPWKTSSPTTGRWLGISRTTCYSCRRRGDGCESRRGMNHHRLWRGRCLITAWHFDRSSTFWLIFEKPVIDLQFHFHGFCWSKIHGWGICSSQFPWISTWNLRYALGGSAGIFGEGPGRRCDRPKPWLPFLGGRI